MDSSKLITSVREYFLALQDRICDAFEGLDGEAHFDREVIETPNAGLSRPRVLADGARIEKTAVQFTHSVGLSLPQAATERNPHLAGAPFQAAAVSLIVHPQNPYVPTTHMNVRFFLIEADTPTWYFGGGYDLTPVYAFREDAIQWHRTAQAATGTHYPALKKRCDEYFYLPHRQECRGIGGIFFDDWVEGGFETSFDFVRRVGDSFLQAYVPIFERRRDTPFGARERDFQLHRRGRYAEFNLAIDRGTKYGLQSGRRVESVLASLPPLVKWTYNYRTEPGSPEAELIDTFLKPQDWVGADTEL